MACIFNDQIAIITKENRSHSLKVPIVFVCNSKTGPNRGNIIVDGRPKFFIFHMFISYMRGLILLGPFLS